jgi:hypothetical protein
MEAKEPEITLGEPICEKIKQLYYNDRPWIECYKDVAKIFTELKRRAHLFYVDKNRVEVLKELSKYCHQDIKDVFHIEQS